VVSGTAGSIGAVFGWTADTGVGWIIYVVVISRNAAESHEGTAWFWAGGPGRMVLVAFGTTWSTWVEIISVIFAVWTGSGWCTSWAIDWASDTFVGAGL
jgi:hypothetical protein